MLKLFDILSAYHRTKRLHFSDRTVLEAYQQRQLEKMRARLVLKSPYFREFAHVPWSQWPLMDKQVMMRSFNSLNTAGLKLEKVVDVAHQAEKSRSFSPTVDGYTVGLSSGTSGSRGVFVVGAREKNRWAGIMLAKALPRGLFAGERAALFLRANSNLYTAVRAPFLKFEFFDLLAVWEQHLERLRKYNPTVIVAPAQVLRRLALEQKAGRIAITPARLLSAAEVLEQQDRDLITSVFGPVLGEVYQATEGFLAVTCSHGNLHLNEEFIHVEPEWLDCEHRRFVPIVTDFSRETQPIVRYRLNDVLVASHEQCSCGSATRVISAIEGRCDDMLRLPGKDGTPVEVFADAVSRVLLQSLPLDTDYQLTQTDAAHLKLEADLTPDQQEHVMQAFAAFLKAQGIAVPLTWTFLVQAPTVDFTRKRRRILRQWAG